MKLAFCLYRFFPFGGLQRDFLKIALECRRRGHNICVFANAWEGDIPQGIEVHPVPARGLSNHSRVLDFARSVQKLLSASTFDVVVGFNKMPGLDYYFAADTCFVARALAERSWLYRIGPRFHSYSSLERSVFDPLEQTQILILSNMEKEKYRRIYQTPAERFHLLPPGISRDRLPPLNAGQIRKDLRKEYGIDENDHLLLMVCSAFQTKGLDRSLLSVAALPSELRRRTHLFVIGEANAQPFQRQASRLGILDRIRFLGGRDDVLRFMLGADLLLHPAYTEAYGMVLLEAMAAGLPVLATEICGFAFHVTQAGAGMIVPAPFAQERLDLMLARMLTSTEKENWQRNGLDYVAKTDIFSLPEKAVDLIETTGSRRGA